MSIVARAANTACLGSTCHIVGTLDSWKSIAGYLNRTVRTAQRWKKYEGLPVHFHFHKKAKTVYALQTELDAWRAGRDLHQYDPPARGNDHRAHWRNNLLILTFRPTGIHPVITLSSIFNSLPGTPPVQNSFLRGTRPRVSAPTANRLNSNSP
jgi:hypothetical protein